MSMNDMSTSPTTPSTTKFAHTRAYLTELSREYGKSNTAASATSQSDTSDSEADSDVRGETTDTDVLVVQLIQMLDNDDEDAVKQILRGAFTITDEPTLEQCVLDLMHKRRDDQANVPFLFLTPIKRPSRPTSRTSFLGSRPGTPVFVPSSPLSMGFRRPSTPLAGTGTISINYPSISPSSSPIPASALPNPIGSGSPSSPRFLNAKASEFRPGMVRSLSSGSIIRGPSPSPDLWAHYAPSPTLSQSSLGGGRGSSNLAIAAPLLPDQTYTPSSSNPDLLDGITLGTRTPPIRIRQDAPQQRPSTFDDADDDDDPFSPFVVKPPLSPQSGAPLLNLGRLGHTSSSDIDTQWSDTSSPSNSYEVPPPQSMITPEEYYNGGYSSPVSTTPNLQRHMRPGYFVRSDSSSSLGVGAPAGSLGAPANGSDQTSSDVVFAEQDMTPFEVLSSVFGSSVSAALLQEALDNSGYDFDGAMAWLVDQALPPPPPGLLQHNMPTMGMGMHSGHGGVGGPSVGRDQGYGAAARLGNNPNGRNTARYGQQQQQQKNHIGNRVCRYFLQGECRRADCRFSHDIDRALCRFWLRGQCAKGDNCEFLHNLPQHIDVQGLNHAMNRLDVDDRDRREDEYQRNDFPSLSQAGNRRGNVVDPTRTRWATAVKKAPTTPITRPSGSHEDDVVRSSSTVSRQSPRLRLRPPSLLPTLPTGEALSKLYMAYRSKALELGAARNACLTQAADAWRRGDGAGAKRHSRAAHDLNTKMGLEAGKAAARLVRERARAAQDAVRVRDAAWSDDPGDRGARGQPCGNGLGVCLGVAGMNMVSDGKRLSPEERTECMLDLHGLHSSEAVEVVEDFLVALELEHFFGLAFLVIGEEKHTGTQDTGRGASRARLGAGVRDWLVKWGYPWLERDGIICVDHLTHSQ